ncbi:ABC transporter ATP-binding protein [Sorangium cellulosum]|uniref:ABC transporter ATP-binding protein n=1 Tax=Sorangium cellulosum TaxID=56 RepID=A0A2L0EI03_SORCE|nr:ABC transporter ATP-binding protein [Sorangium cellulosum]AUX38916.1 ABC transporter ATP-binding protein [Sorangium cellulosum]
MFSRLRESFAHTPRTLRLVWRSSPRGSVALGLLTVAAALLPLAVAYAGKRIMDAVVEGSAAATLRWVLFELAAIGAQALAQRGLGLVRSLLGARLGLDINGMILEKALSLELRHFEDPEFYDQLSRARGEAATRPLSVVSETFQLLQNAITLAGYVVLLFHWSSLAVLLLLLAAVPATVAEVRYSSAAFRMRNVRSPEGRLLKYLEHVLANDGHAKEVKAFGIGRALLERFRSLGESFYEEDKKLSVRRAGWGYALSLLGTSAFYGCYAVMALAAAARRLSLGELVLYVVAFRQGQQAFQAILTALGGMYEDNLYMSNLFKYLDIPVEAPALLSAMPGSDKEGIVFEDVGFRYPGAEKWALRHVNLHIKSNESLALVGHNGAGKTTFIKLLSRLYEPTEGRILLDGRDLRSWEPEALRRRIGVVFQDFNQYQLKMRDNVGLGSVEHLRDEARMLRAVERGGAGELLAGLPRGLETQLGRAFRDGTQLSGGQWQKIALARAFMREEADILVLDEPTAALDAEAEHVVFERFRALSRDRTSILISHRFPTVRMADRIVVIEGGSLLEEGTHDMLVARGGRYAELFALQAKGYL